MSKHIDLSLATRAKQKHGSTVVTVDGVNDAPALALADVDIAMDEQGAVAAARQLMLLLLLIVLAE